MFSFSSYQGFAERDEGILGGVADLGQLQPVCNVDEWLIRPVVVRNDLNDLGV